MLVEVSGVLGVLVGGWSGVKMDFCGDIIVGNLSVY